MTEIFYENLKKTKILIEIKSATFLTEILINFSYSSYGLVMMILLCINENYHMDDDKKHDDDNDEYDNRV